MLGGTPFDTILDACCGTGGFLIDVLAEMRGRVESNASLTNQEQESLKEEIATRRIFGVDVAKDPPLARIARMNMYLHGDGGSSIYQADALDKKLADDPNDSPEIKREKSELRGLLGSSEGFADVVLTNPPFAKEYSREFPRDNGILDEYQLSFDESGGARRPRPRLRSSLMFLERYHDLLKPGGRLVTVIDDSILGGERYRDFRSFIRNRFIVRGVVSLPGDAFQRARARVKTSLLVLQKKQHDDEGQPPVFMYYCTKVGIDDSPRERALPIDRINRAKAAEEIERVGKSYDLFLKGSSAAKKWTVPPERIRDRMDVKSCLLNAGQHVGSWKKAGLTVAKLSELVDIVDSDTPEHSDRVIVTAERDDPVTHLRVRYEGFVEKGEEIFASDSKYSRLFLVKEDDIVISHINAVHGAIGIVPSSLVGTVVTSEYTICRAKEGLDGRLVWALLRSPEARSELLLLSTGIGRSRVQWATASELRIPLPPGSLADRVVKRIRNAEAREEEARKMRHQAQEELEEALDLSSDRARTILAAFKPPR